jgi:lipoprotein-anchoring transpeptidase ErfK/SrfK
VYFNGGIAVHGAASVPDHPASHGCVRIPMSIAEYFPTLVNTGDPIEVFRS